MNYDVLITSITETHSRAQKGAAQAVNQKFVLRNWLIGAYIIEFEQNGQDRSRYGTGLLKRLANDLKSREISGLGTSTLKNCRIFYRLYPQIRQPAVGELQTTAGLLPIGQPPVDDSFPPRNRQPVVGDSTAPLPFPLPATALLHFSWTHFLEFIRFDDPWKRAFYENECLKGNWSKRQLQRQIGSLLYERTGLSTDKETVINHARKQAPENPQAVTDLIRDPYILEFTGLAEKPHYLEKDLEAALLDHIQTFLLELGNGFCFEARQKRVTVGNEHDYIDLVFYNRKLRCHLLIDLKIRAFQHGDAGQIHPMRYSHHEQISLCLRPALTERREVLYGLHSKPAAKTSRARSWESQFDKKSPSRRTYLLRGLPLPSRCNQTRKISQNSLGKTLPQGSARKLSHGVNFYLNYWKDQMMEEGDNPPVGLILCAGKESTKVEYATAGMDQQLFVSRYLVALPKPEELEALIEQDQAVFDEQAAYNSQTIQE